MTDADREPRGLPVVETLLKDARYAARSLGRTPGFTVAALLTLALGIGATAGVFSVVRAVLLRPLPYPESERIVQVLRAYPGGTGSGHTGRRYLAFREEVRGVEALAAWRGPTGANLAVGDRAEFVRASRVSSEWFTVFGVAPALGRGFTVAEDTTGGPDVAVLSHELWTRLFAARPSAIGAAISLGGEAFTVVGVMPAAFQPLQPADLFLPLRPSTTGPGGGFNYSVGGRLRPGVTIEQARAEVGSAWRGLQAAQPTEMIRDEQPSTVEPLAEMEAREPRPVLLMMLGAVGLLLLIACANTASLLLARASGREREMAVRAALGASRGRIIRQLLTESVILAAAGAAAGILLAGWSVPALLTLAPPALAIRGEVPVDLTVVLVTLGLSIVTGIGFGLAPALGLSRGQLTDAMKEDGTRTTAGRGAGLARRALVVAQVAICMALLVGAGLLLRTVMQLRAVDLGFDPGGVITGQMSLQGARYAEPAAWNRLFDEGLARLRELPGVEGAAVVNGVPIERGLNLNVDVLDGPEPIARALTDWRYASPGYFEAMGMRLAAGRPFDDRDRAGAAPVAVVNQEFERRFFKGTPALGRHIRVFATDPPIEIVGIARDVREQGLTADLPAVMFVPVAQANPAGVRASHTYFQMNWVVRAPRASAGLTREIEQTLRAIDPQQPISAFRTMDEVRGAQLATERFELFLLGAFAGVGLAIAAAGIYGLMAFTVAHRTREIGIRMALGASRSRVVGSIVGGAATLVGLGIAVGALISTAFSGVLRNFIWGVSPGDPWTFTTVAVLLLTVAIVASLVPALRAARLDPTRVLRE